MVPRTRLIFWTSLIVPPFSLLTALIPSTVAAAGGIIAFFCALVLLDAWLARNRLATIQIVLPEIVRLSKGREGTLSLRIDQEQGTLRRLRIGLPLPAHLGSRQPDVRINLPEGNFPVVYKWPLHPFRQGLYTLPRCYLETSSPMGFWVRRTIRPANTQLRIYPNLYEERQHMASLFLRQRLGIHSQRQLGKGRDFEQLREYLPGDGYEDIHWKATARRLHPVTKVHQVERSQDVYVIIDASRLSGRDAQGMPSGPGIERRGLREYPVTILERYITAALMLGLITGRQGDLFGLIVFNNQVQKFIRAKGGRSHFDVCRDALFTLTPQSVSPDYTELFTFIGTRIRRRALLLVLTSLDDPMLAEAFTQSIDIIGRRHLVLVNVLKPFYAEPLFTDPAIEDINDIYRRLGGHLEWESLRETGRKLRRHGVDLTLLDNAELCAQLISRYLNVKQRQIL